MSEFRDVPIQAIKIPRKRMRVTNHVPELAAAILQAGERMINPITLRKDGLVLIAGRRRLEAAKLLKWSSVPALVLDVDEQESLILEIDENLQRAELTALQRAEHIDERKKVWLARYPETGKGKAEGAGKGRGKKSRALEEPHHAVLPNGELPKAFALDTAEKTGTSRATVERYAKVGEALCGKAKHLLAGSPIEDKITELLKIARKPNEEQVAVAQKLKAGEASTVHQAERLIQAAVIQGEPRPLPTGPFRVIVADPPWHYGKRLSDASKRENFGYPSMSLDEIKALPVAQLAAKDALLWLWTTNAHLPDAFTVIDAWGFTYKTCLTWGKKKPGMGEWLRGLTEHCLLAVRGRPTVTLTNQTTLIQALVVKHSRKPEEFYRLVESLCPGSKVELFCRGTPQPGWQGWGADCKKEK